MYLTKNKFFHRGDPGKLSKTLEVKFHDTIRRSRKYEWIEMDKLNRKPAKTWNCVEAISFCRYSCFLAHTWRHERLELELVAEDGPDIRLSEGGLLRGSVAGIDKQADLGAGARLHGPVADGSLATNLTQSLIEIEPGKLNTKLRMTWCGLKSGKCQKKVNEGCKQSFKRRFLMDVQGLRRFDSDLTGGQGYHLVTPE